MQETETRRDELPVVFNPPAAGVVGVHDYSYNAATGAFDYVDNDLVGMTFADAFRCTDGNTVVVRPIVSVIDILNMLRSERCVCLVNKQTGRSSCYGCYRSLPPELQRNLYRKFRAGYEQAFLASLIYLIEAGRTDVDRILASVPASGFLRSATTII